MLENINSTVSFKIHSGSVRKLTLTSTAVSIPGFKNFCVPSAVLLKHRTELFTSKCLIKVLKVKLNYNVLKNDEVQWEFLALKVIKFNYNLFSWTVNFWSSEEDLILWNQKPKIVLTKLTRQYIITCRDHWIFSTSVLKYLSKNKLFNSLNTCQCLNTQIYKITDKYTNTFE